MVKLILIKTKETFELFDSIEKAFDYCKNNKIIPKIDLVDVNHQNIYFEEDGELNYEDNSTLIRQGILSDVY